MVKAHPPASLHILLVEDRDEDAQLIKRELKRAEISCRTLRVDTADGLRRELRDFAPDIVLADYSIPGFGGMAALEMLRREAPLVPLIIVTGSLDEETAAECIKAGAADYVLKNHLVRLGPAVSSALALRRSRAERAAAEAALKANEQRFRALVEHSWDAVALFRSDGAILYGSPATTRILGYDLAEFTGLNALELIHPEDRDTVVGRLTESMANPRGRVDVAARVRHKDGSWRYLEGVFTNLLDDPSVAAIVNNYRDATERRSLEQPKRHLVYRGAITVLELQLNLADWLSGAALDSTNFAFVYRGFDPCHRPWLQFDHRPPDNRFEQRSQLALVDLAFQ